MQLCATQPRAWGIYAAITILVILTTTWLILPESSAMPSLSMSGVRTGSGDSLLADTQNATLGFQKLFVVNLPERTDRSDKMSLMGAATGIHFDFLPAVKEEDVLNKAMPPGGDKWVGQVRGSWRAHVNAMRAVVDQNLSSAVIFEDDLDWDVRIKRQIYDFALSARALNQPLAHTVDTFADPTFPVVHDTSMDAPNLDLKSLPKTQPPRKTPYGDNWDLLWLGHCGMRRPLVNEEGGPWHDLSLEIPKGVVTHKHDDTVPQKNKLHWWVDHIYNDYKDAFPEHTRITHHAMDAVCNFAYAVTQQGAQKILYELGMMQMNDPFDLMLRDFCNSKRGHEGKGGTCLTVQPGLFSHFIKNTPREGEKGDPGWERTKNIRFSTWANLPKLLKGETDYTDQWPDD